jgi:hypothetical protein
MPQNPEESQNMALRIFNLEGAPKAPEVITNDSTRALGLSPSLQLWGMRHAPNLKNKRRSDAA